MGEWQPIETAPKDGRYVLVFYPDGSGARASMEFGRWTDDRYASRPRPHWTGTAEYYRGRMWVKNNAPTHWMPLPDPPEAT